MTKKDFQKQFNITDDEMEWIAYVKKEVKGTVVSVSEVPRDASGQAIPFPIRK